MQQTIPFEALSDDENVPGRLYNDGRHNIWIVETKNLYARKRQKYREREIEIAPATLSELKEAGEKKNVLSDNPNFDDDYVAEILANSTPIELTEETPDETAFTQNNGQKTIKMTSRALFDLLYTSIGNRNAERRDNHHRRRCATQMLA